MSTTVQAATQLQSPHPGPEPVQHIFQVASGILAVAALRATLLCRVADHVADGPRNVADLARLASVNEDALYRSLRATAMMGIFTEVAPRVFANTPASSVLRSDHPSRALDSALWMTNPLHFRTYAEFDHSLRTGETCVEKATGHAIFDYFPTDHECNCEFNNAMTSISLMVIPAVLEAYDFSGMGTLCDVAGGHGMLLTSILKKHPDLSGILFDLEHVVAGGRERIQAEALSSRCGTASGDFFQAVPAADNYIMKHIIHDWDDQKAATILRNCAKAMRGNGKILLVEAVLSQGNDPHLGKLIDIEMLAMPGGRERSEPEFAELFKEAGLRLNRVIQTQAPLWVLEAVKA